MIEKVKAKANELYSHFAGLFNVPVANFARAFEAAILEFREATKHMEKTALLELVVDPTAS